MKRPLVIVLFLVLIGASFVVARWINNDTVERARVERAAASRRCAATPPACCAGWRRARTRPASPSCAPTPAGFAAPGELRIALYQSQTAHALRSRTKYTRVVWFASGRRNETTVQCVLVRREGNVFAGMTVSLLRVTAPIRDRESSCPPS